MRNKRIPNYPDDADYTTNTPSYYDDLARKQKLIELLAKRIWEYEETLDLTLEEISNRLESYIDENDLLMSDRLEQWDLNLEKFPENVELLLQEWLSDGTLDHIINDTIFNWKLDATIFEQFRDSTTAQLAQIAINPKNFGAIGDGVADDTEALQNCFNHAYENSFKVNIPAGVYRITKPLLIYGHSEDYSNKSTIIEGAGRGVTRIVKNTNTTFTIPDQSPEGLHQHSQNIDAIFIIVNEYTKNGEPILQPWSNQSIAKKVFISHLTLESTATTRVENGIFSLGYYFCKFFEIEFINMNKAMVTKRYNCYNTFENIEVFVKGTGFEFLTPIGGNTTMLYKNIHLNGVDQYGFNIKGNATFTNCSNDGGWLTPYKLRNGIYTLIACHFESPQSTRLIDVISSQVTVVNCAMEIPRVNNSIVLNATTNSRITVSGGYIALATARTEFPPTSPGRLLSADKTSRVIIEDIKLLHEHFDIPSHYSVSVEEKHIVVDRNHLNTPYNKYRPYLWTATPIENRSILTVTPNESNKTLDVEVNNIHGPWAVLFNEPIKFDGYSRLYMRADLDFGEGSHTGSNEYEVSLNVQKTLTADGFISEGVEIPSLRKDIHFYDKANHEFYIDISDLYGNYYVEVRITNISKAKIKEISLLK